MSRLRPFGWSEDWPAYPDTDQIIGYLEALIRDEEERGDISAADPTPRGRRLNRAYAALDALHSIDNTHP